MRRAFARIDELTNELANRTSFTDARVIEYPLDASIRSSVAGEISRDQMAEEARFQLRLVYPLVQELVAEESYESF